MTRTYRLLSEQEETEGTGKTLKDGGHQGQNAGGAHAKYW